MKRRHYETQSNDRRLACAVSKTTMSDDKVSGVAARAVTRQQTLPLYLQLFISENNNLTRTYLEFQYSSANEPLSLLVISF